MSTSINSAPIVQGPGCWEVTSEYASNAYSWLATNITKVGEGIWAGAKVVADFVMQIFSSLSVYFAHGFKAVQGFVKNNSREVTFAAVGLSVGAIIAFTLSKFSGCCNKTTTP
jgi:hypothetical protein